MKGERFTLFFYAIFYEKIEKRDDDRCQERRKRK
jgi:hypothetical protein